MRLVALVLLALSTAATALAQPSRARVVARVGAEGPHRTKSIQALAGQTVELTVRVGKGRGRLRPLPPGATVSWRRITPQMQHVKLPPRNARVPIYSNSALFGRDHGRWIGLDTIEYVAHPLVAGPGVVVSGATVTMTSPRGAQFGGAGTAWIGATVTLPGGATIATPDETSTDQLGLKRSVMRVSFRADNSLLGWTSTYFGVPYIFGSTGPQVDRYSGADCADVFVGARRAAGHRRTKYVSVRSINLVARPTTKALTLGADGVLRHGSGAPRPLRWGADVRAGDLLVMDFSSESGTKMMPAMWDHIGALSGDNQALGSKGLLDGADTLRHMADNGLSDVPLSRMGSIRLRLWRFR